MGAIAVSEKEERQIEKLSKQLKIPTKSGVIRAALRTLEEKVEKERLRQEIQESVRRCAAADKQENRELFAAAVARNLRKQ
jgi:Arc/MetJ-type ribon-helix-helix transcriptional regulator